MTEKEYREQFSILKMQENYERDENKRKGISNKLRNLESTYKQTSVTNRRNELDDMLSQDNSDFTMELHDTEIGGKIK